MATEKQEGYAGSTLESRIAVLEELFVRLAQAGATESILGCGFEQVSAGLKTVSDRLQDIAVQVAPLRNLAPVEPPLRPEQRAVMANLYKALVPPVPVEDKKKPPTGEEDVGLQQRSAS